MNFKLVEIDLLIVNVEDDYKTFGGIFKNIVYTERRHNNSIDSLNYDLYRFNIKNEPYCTCGFLFIECLL